MTNTVEPLRIVIDIPGGQYQQPGVGVGMALALVVITLGAVIGAVWWLAPLDIGTVGTSPASSTGIGSFSGAQALNDLVPVVYNAVVMMIGVGMITVGFLGFAGRGPAAVLPQCCRHLRLPMN